MNHLSKNNNKYYNNYTVGVIAMLFGIATPIVLPILGSFLAPIVYLGGLAAILIAKKPWWLRITTVLLLTLPLLFFWNQYATFVMEYIMEV